MEVGANIYRGCSKHGLVTELCDLVIVLCLAYKVLFPVPVLVHNSIAPFTQYSSEPHMINELWAGSWNGRNIWRRGRASAHVSNLVISLFGGGRKPDPLFTSPIGIHNSAALVIIGDKGYKNILPSSANFLLK